MSEHIQDVAGAHGPYATDKIETKTPGEPGDIVAHFQQVKLAIGEKGTAVSVSHGVPWPVGGETLSEILTELKLIKLYLAENSDNEYTVEDTE